jgi:serine/threonine protein kinase
LDLKEERALKVLKKTSLKSEEEFLNEINMLMMIDHPNVLKLYEIY